MRVTAGYGPLFHARGIVIAIRTYRPDIFAACGTCAQLRSLPAASLWRSCSRSHSLSVPCLTQPSAYPCNRVYVVHNQCSSLTTAKPAAVRQGSVCRLRHSVTLILTALLKTVSTPLRGITPVSPDAPHPGQSAAVRYSPLFFNTKVLPAMRWALFTPRPDRQGFSDQI